MKHTTKLLQKLIAESEAIVIGAGAGLSAAAGFEYGGKTFLDNFSWMHERYGYTDMYSAGFHAFSTSEEKWAYWSRFVYLERYQGGAKRLYQSLFSLVRGRNYFVITTNVDHQFQLAGFDKERLFYPQGDYGLFQCSLPCHQKTYDNKKWILKMVHDIKDNRIPTRDIPHCPICGREMAMNLRCDGSFAEDEGWIRAHHRYVRFLEENRTKRVLFLELGVGFNTPGIIKYPFWQMTYRNLKAIYACVNNGEMYAPKEIADRSVCIDGDIGEVLKELDGNQA